MQLLDKVHNIPRLYSNGLPRDELLSIIGNNSLINTILSVINGSVHFSSFHNHILLFYYQKVDKSKMRRFMNTDNCAVCMLYKMANKQEDLYTTFCSLYVKIPKIINEIYLLDDQHKQEFIRNINLSTANTANIASMNIAKKIDSDIYALLALYALNNNNDLYLYSISAELSLIQKMRIWYYLGNNTNNYRLILNCYEKYLSSITSIEIAYDCASKYNQSYVENMFSKILIYSFATFNFAKIVRYTQLYVELFATDTVEEAFVRFIKDYANYSDMRMLMHIFNCKNNNIEITQPIDKKWFIEDEYIIDECDICMAVKQLEQLQCTHKLCSQCCDSWIFKCISQNQEPICHMCRTPIYI